MPVDVRGKELKVGQTVAYTEQGSYKGIRVSTIAKIAPKMVIMDDATKYRSGTRRDHSYVVILEEANDE